MHGKLAPEEKERIRAFLLRGGDFFLGGILIGLGTRLALFRGSFLVVGGH